MAHPYRGQAKASSQSKYKGITGYAGGGQVYGNQTQHKSYAKGGSIKSDDIKAAGKYARGGRAKGRVNVTIVVPQGGGAPPLPPAMGDPAARPGLTPVGPAPGGGPMPMMRKAGGRIKMTGGAEGGLGRLQKAKNAKVARG